VIGQREGRETCKCGERAEKIVLAIKGALFYSRAVGVSRGGGQKQKVAS
jgi:hypothetical protein